MDQVEKYKIEIFIPQIYLEALRQALHEADAGQTDKYDYCMNVCSVTSFWRPLTGVAPHQGNTNQLEQIEECKVELFCPASNVSAVLQAVRSLHPYEEAGIYVIPLFNHLFE